MWALTKCIGADGLVELNKGGIMTRITVLLAAIATLGCKEIEPAPKEQEELMQFFFSDLDDASDETMAEAFRNFDAAVDGANLEYSEGIVANLAKEDTDRTGYTHADPANGIGVYIINPVACTMDQMVDLVTMKDQVGTYGTYETFDRTWVQRCRGFPRWGQYYGHLGRRFPIYQWHSRNRLCGQYGRAGRWIQSWMMKRLLGVACWSHVA